MTQYEVADKLGLSRSTVYQWIQRYGSEMKQRKIIDIDNAGFKKRIRILDLDEFAKFMEEKGAKFPKDRKEM